MINEKSKLHLMFDLETLSTHADAVILSFSCIPYHLEESSGKTMMELVNEGFDAKFDAKEQIDAGRHVSKSTLEFWKQQGPEAQAIMKPDPKRDIKAREFHEKFSSWLEKIGYDPGAGIAWQRGNIDIIWLDSFYEQMLGIENANDKPIRWYRVNDVRTAVNVSGNSSKLNGYPDGFYKAMELHFPGCVDHNSLHDCAKQILQLKVAGIF